MDKSKRSNSRHTKGKGRRANLAKKSPHDSISIQKNNHASIFDFNDPDDDEFDVKSVKKIVRGRRKKAIEVDNEHPTSSVNSPKEEGANTTRRLANKPRNPKSCDVDTLASDRKLFTTCVDDSKKCEENISPSSRNKLLVNSVESDANKETTKFENGDLGPNNLQGTCPRLSLIDKSIENLEKLEKRKKDQDGDCGRNNEEEEDEILNETPMPSVANQSTKSKKFCPICHIVFVSSETDNEITIHVNACLDLPNRRQKNSELPIDSTSITDEPCSAVSEDKIKIDEDFARELQERENAKVIEEKLSDELFFCGICQKDLNRLSAASREVHMNRCADFCEKENTVMRRVQRKSLMETSKEFECLICGEKFSSNLQKVSHMKKCCKESNIDRRELLQLVREVSTNDLALNTAQKSDDQLSNPTRTVNDLVMSSAVHSKSDTKRRKKNRRKKSSNEEIPILLTRSEEEAQKIALSKAAKMIEEASYIQSSTEKRHTICLPESKIANKYKRIIDIANKREFEKGNESHKTTSSKVGHKKCVGSIWEFSDIKTPLFETPKFYVPGVFGEDLERTVERLKQNEKSVVTNVQDHSKQDGSMAEMHLLSTSMNESVNFDDKSKLITDSIASRAKCSVIVEQNDEIAVFEGTGTTCNVKIENGGGENESCTKVGCNGFLDADLNDNHSSKFKLELDKFNCKAKESLLLNLESLLSDEETKDVELLCANDEVHKAHSCILRARCPTLREGGKVLDFTRYSETVVATVLRYIYIGEINHEMKDPEDVHELANWLSLELLAEACTAILNEHGAREDQIDIAGSLEKSNIDDLEKTLWHADINPDVEGETESGQKGLSDVDSPFDESDEENLRYFIATQRERCSSSENCDDGILAQFRSKDTDIDMISRDDSAEDEECYLLDAEDSGTTSTVISHETGNEPSRATAKTSIWVPPGRSKDVQNRRTEQIKVSTLSCSSDVAFDEDHPASVGVHLECLYKEGAGLIDCEVKEESIIHRLDVDVSKKVRYSPDEPVESGSDCDRSSSDDRDRCFYAREATTDETGTQESIGNHKKSFNEMGSRSRVKLGQPDKSTQLTDGDHLMTGLQIVDLRSPDLKFDSDEEALFDSSYSGGLDTAICIDENEDDDILAEDQMNGLEDESKSLELNAESVIKTPEDDTVAPNSGYDNGENSLRRDISDLCDSGSVELQSESKQTLIGKEPVSPCVTTSQFGRKCNSENSDHFDRDLARGLPAISQKIVINLDEEESGDEERIGISNHPARSGDSITGNALLRGLSNLRESDFNVKSLYQNDNARVRKGERESNAVNSAEEAILADDAGLVLQTSSDEEQAQEFINEERGSSCLQHRPCSEQSFLKEDGAFATAERLGNREQSLCPYVESTEIQPEMMTLGKAIPLDEDDASSDEVIDITPNFDAESPKIAQLETICSTSGAKQSNDDDVRIQFCRSSSPVIPRLSPEFLPPSFDREMRCTVNKSPGSLKRKTLFGSGSLSQYRNCIDEIIIDEYNHPSKRMKLDSTTMEVSPRRSKYSDLESKSPCMHNSDSQSSSDSDKAFSNRSRCNEEKSPQSACGSNSNRIQKVEGNDGFCKVQHSNSYLDCFDDGGFNPDINCENFISSTCSFTETDTFVSRRKKNDEKNDEQKERKLGENVIEINSETDMFDFSDDGGFNSDVMQYASASIETGENAKTSSINSIEVDNSKWNTMRTNRIGPGREDHVESSHCDALSRNIENADRCISDSLVTVDEDRRDTSKSKMAVGKRIKRQKDQAVTNTKSLASINVTAAQTPCNELKAFGPGCSVHPETGAAITPMSDYDSLQTPILAKRVKQYGLRKLPKHQMAGKMREIYKMKHGFTDWEEPPTKPKRKAKRKHAFPNKIGRANDDKSAHENSESSTSSDDEGQKTFEGCYSDDELCSQACSQSDQTDKTLSEKLLKFFKDRKELYEKILMYQKLNFDEIYKLVKEAKIKCSKSRLTEFLDEQCICFVVPKADDKPRAQRRKKT